MVRLCNYKGDPIQYSVLGVARVNLVVLTDCVERWIECEAAGRVEERDFPQYGVNTCLMKLVVKSSCKIKSTWLHCRK